MTHFLVFQPADNPMQLSKIGNWLFTYLSPIEEKLHIVLAITSVLPHQLSHGLQPQRMIITGQAKNLEWEIQHIEFFDNIKSKTQIYPLTDIASTQFIQQFIDDCAKYDVDICYQSSDS